jgi:predicted DNA-binding transcriptional regulator YafY
MTHNQTLAALDRFEATLGQLSQAYPHEVDFWPAFATYANELEATSPLDFRDYVRDSIVRMLRKIGRLPATN